MISAAISCEISKMEIFSQCCLTDQAVGLPEKIRRPFLGCYQLIENVELAL